MTAVSHPGINAVLIIISADPREALGITIAIMQSRFGSIELIQIRNQFLDAVMKLEFGEFPIELSIVIPSVHWAISPPMKSSFLPGVVN